MIERQFVNQKLKEFQIQEYIASQLSNSGYSHTEIRRTPLGEKIIIYTTRPGIVVGRKGENIQNLTNVLKKRFKMDNPQIEIGEVENPMIDVNYVCDRIVSTLERFGSKRFKSVGYKMLQGIMDAGARGAEIKISGKIPGSRARSWRFSEGHLKKSGDISENYVKRAIGVAKLKPGVIGVKVMIMPPDVVLPSEVKLRVVQEVKTVESPKEIAAEKSEEKIPETKEEKNKESKDKQVIEVKNGNNKEE